MIDVAITPTIKRRLLAIAHARNDGKLPEQSRKQSKKFTDLEVDYMGAIGEYVASAVCDVPFDEQSYGRKGDNGVDMVIRGVKCAIKANHRRNGYLIIERESDVANVDALVLVDGPCDAKLPRCACMVEQNGIGETTEIWRLVGWMPVQDFLANATETDWGLGRRLWVRRALTLGISTIGMADPFVHASELRWG